MGAGQRGSEGVFAATTETADEVLVVEDATSAPGATSLRGRWDRLQGWAHGLRPAWRGLIAYLLYQSLAFVIWVLPVVDHFEHQAVGVGLQDSRYFQWALTWTPWAVAHGVDPLHNGTVFPPTGLNLAWTTFIPGPALVLWPITSLFGALTSLNIAMAAAPALAAWGTYLVCNRLTGRFWPSVVGGYLFGFSAYFAGNMIGFANLLLIFPVPLLVYLAVRRVEGSLGPVAFVAGFSATLIGLFSVSTELFCTAAIFLGIAFLLGVAFGRPIRGDLLRMGALVLLSGVITTVLLLPYLIAVVSHAPSEPLFPSELMPAADVWNFVVPPPYEQIGGSTFATLLNDHIRAPVLFGIAYVGIAIPVMLVGFAVTERRRRETWALLTFVALLTLLALGPVLRIGGAAHGYLPVHWFAKIPIIQSAIPARFAAYSGLAIGIIAALWLARASGRAGWIRWGVVLLAAVMLLPHAPQHSPPQVFPAFFSSDAVQQQIGAGENVYPITVQRGDENVWQATSGYRFTLAEAYFGPLPVELRDGVLSQGLNMRRNVQVPIADVFASWTERHQVSAVIMDDRAADRYEQMLVDAGFELRYQGEGVSVWRPAGTPPPGEVG